MRVGGAWANGLHEGIFTCGHHATTLQARRPSHGLLGAPVVGVGV